MKTPYTHIYKILRLNRFIVLAVLVMAFLSSVISALQVHRAHREHLKNSFAIDPQGAVYPLKREASAENLKVEAEAHLDNFHRGFYHLSPSNYKESLERALWLGDQSVDELYRQKRVDGIYNRILQYGLLQKVTAVKSNIDLSREPYAFETRMEFEIKRGSTTDYYHLRTSGKLERIARSFPYNPHGFVITGFFEEELKKISDEDR